jgi:hypothetical protein
VTELAAALLPVAGALRTLGVPYYVGGSIASSARGTPRASLDADVVVALALEHVDPLIAAIGDAYYASREGMVRAIVARRSFNLIHLATMFKIDMFVTKGRPYDVGVFDRATTEVFEVGEPAVMVASAEDTVLAKLEWFQAGGGVSERQWSDVIGVIEGDRPLDLVYLRRWAADLGVASLLEQALAESRSPR